MDITFLIQLIYIVFLKSFVFSHLYNLASICFAAAFLVTFLYFSSHSSLSIEFRIVLDLRREWKALWEKLNKTAGSLNEMSQVKYGKENSEELSEEVMETDQAERGR